MKKRILSLFLLAAILIPMNVSVPSSTVVSAITSEEESEKMEYIEKENVVIDGHQYEYIQYCRDKQKKTIRIMSLKTKEDILIIPAKIDGEAVLTVGGTYGEFKLREEYLVDGRFEVDKVLAWQTSKEQELKKIVVSEGIEKVVDMGFINTEAECIEFPKSLKLIGDETGDTCFTKSKIKHVILKGKKTIIGGFAFAYSDLKKITLPKNFQGKICFSAFEETKLEKFVWPSYKGNVTKKIEYSTFAKCRNLKKVVFPKNQKHIYIPEACFWGCTKLKKLTFPASTKKVTYSSSAYADNYKKGVGTLVFKGKKTKLAGCEYKREGKCKVFVTVGKIIAPKKSKTLAMAKKAKRIKWIAKGVQKNLGIHTDPGENFSELGSPSVKFAKMKYSVLKKK